MSCSRFAFPEILLACFANTWVVLFPEIPHATHPDLYVLVTSRASDFAFVDGQVWVRTFGGFLKVRGMPRYVFRALLRLFNDLHQY